SANQELVPPGAILIEQQNGLSRGTDPSPRTRRLELHQRDETVNLWFSWGELGENSAQAERIFAEPRPHPVISRGGGVALVENQVDHLEDGGKTGAEICRTRNFERDMSVRERPLGPDDSLGDGRFRDEEGPCDLVGRQTSEQAQRERHSRFGGKDGMTGGEDETQQIVAEVVVDLRLELPCRAFLFGLLVAAELFMFARRHLSSAKLVDGAMLGGRHEPGSRLVRNARLRPFLERHDERILGEILRKTDVTDNASKRRNQPGRFYPPDGVDGLMGVGSLHGYRSHHRRSGGASARRFRLLRICAYGAPSVGSAKGPRPPA